MARGPGAAAKAGQLTNIPSAQDRTTLLGVVAPLPLEAHCLVRQRVAPGAIIELPGGGWLRVSGTGPARARAAAAALVDAGADALLSWGMAGALDPKLAVGALLLPPAVVGEGERLPVDDHWRSKLVAALRDVLPAASAELWQNPEVVSTVAAKAALRRATGCSAVDMESVAIGAVARAAGIPFLVVRAVSDSAAMVLPAEVLGAVDEYGTASLRRLADGALRRPTMLRDLAQLAHGMSLARRTLRRVARALGADGLGP